MIKDVCLDIYIKEQSDVLTPGASGILYEKVGGLNRPFLSYLKPLFQSEAWCTTIHMKMSLICM